MDEEKNTRGESWSFRRFVRLLGGLIGIVTILGVVVAGLQFSQQLSSSRQEESAQATQVWILESQLDVQGAIATLQWESLNAGEVEKTEIAARLSALQNTQSALESIQPSAPQGTQSPPRATETSGLVLSPTPAGDVYLESNETYVLNGLLIRVQNPTFIQSCQKNTVIGYELFLSNETESEIAVSLSSSDMSVRDDLGKSFDNIWWIEGTSADRCYSSPIAGFDLRALRPGESKTYAFRVYGDYQDQANSYIVDVHDAGRIESVSWRISIPK